MEPEIERGEVRFWLRNIDRKQWALAVPYELNGETKTLYPAFLVVREDHSGELVVDILDPHSISLEDAPAKAAGVARYADKHANDFGRIELIIVQGGQLRRIDLSDEVLRAKVRAVQTHAHLRQLFATG
jgi:type III restriction enzyme